ncbi:MAG TPA: GAF domain-containing SpoIIE family protein phosphatase [Aggregatilineales bacterium]|nr:GAF domain-containing SpoIIE family protein phosphatase [Aggregatilineales bacterium]
MVQRTNQPFSIDRPTAIGIGAIVAAILILAILIAGITLLPAQTISQSVSAQASEQQKQQVNSFAARMLAYFTDLTSEMVALTDRPEIQTADAEQFVEDTATRLGGEVKAIALFKQDGTLYYKYPVNKLLDWDTNAASAQNFIKAGGFQFERLDPIPSTSNDYLLIKPIKFASVSGGVATINTAGVLVFEIDLNNYLAANFDDLSLSPTSRLWVFETSTGPTPVPLYSYKQMTFMGNYKSLQGVNEVRQILNFPSSDREAVAVSVTTPYMRRGTPLSFTIVLSRTTGEAQQGVVSTLQTLFLVGLLTIAVLVVAGGLLGRFLLREVRHRRQEEQRRSTARALLEMARALNSSLDLNVVFRRILAELGTILPHESASIMLLNDDKKSVTIAAEAGGDAPEEDHASKMVPLNELRGAREVVHTGRPVVINDCLHDPRWKVTGTSHGVQAWLGVPLRVRNEAVGVLNINSHEPNRFLPDDIDFAEAFADQASVAIQNARAHELEIRVFEAELETARAIQNSLLPQEAPPVPQLNIAARNVAAQHVSGDYYQYYPLPGGKLGVAIGDVSGKGIPAALLMAVVTTTMRDEILHTSAPAALLNELNSRLLPRMKQNDMNSALLVTLFDPATRHVEIANAGMVQPYVFDGSTWDSVPVGGYPLGASARMSYTSRTVTLAPGMILLMISDGVIEARNEAGEFFGFDGLEALLAQAPATLNADQFADVILNATRAHLAGQELEDDITVVVMKSID